jgi:hypothetical protein
MKVLPRHGQEENLNLQEGKTVNARDSLRWRYPGRTMPRQCRVSWCIAAPRSLRRTSASSVPLDLLPGL